MYDYGIYYLPVCIFREEYEKNKSTFERFIESLMSLFDDTNKTDDGEWTISVGKVNIILRKSRGRDWPEVTITKMVKIELEDCVIVSEQIQTDDQSPQNSIYIHNKVGQKFTYKGLLSDHKGVLTTVLDAIFRSN